MGEPGDFGAYAALVDELIAKATKEQLADVARLFALNIRYYHEKFGDVPQETLLRMVRAESLDDETLRLLGHGMQNLVSALAEVMEIAEAGEEASRLLSRTRPHPLTAGFGPECVKTVLLR